VRDTVRETLLARVGGAAVRAVDPPDACGGGYPGEGVEGRLSNALLPYRDENVANRNVKVWHGATENAP
jgi:hypothetical protein